MKRTRWSGLVVATGLVLGTAACGGGGSDGDGGGETITIGYLASLTGPAANDAARDVAGAEVAVDELNEAGGIDGHQVELVVRDDKSDPTVGTREARDLVLTEEVNVLAGGNISSVAAGIQQVAGQTKTPYIISTAGAASLIEETGNPYTFRSWTNTASLPGPMAEWAAEQDFERIAIIYANNANGIERATSFKSIVAENDPEAEIVGEVAIEPTDTDFSSTINRVNAMDADAVLMAGVFGSTLQGLIKQALPLGLYDDAIAMAFISNTDLAALADVGLPPGKQVAYNNFFPTIDDPFVTEFDEKIQEATDQQADGSDFVGYTTIQWVAAAVEAAGSIERQEIADALPGLTLDTFVGEVTMREDGQATGQSWFGRVEDDRQGGLTIVDAQTAPSDDFLTPLG